MQFFFKHTIQLFVQLSRLEHLEEIDLDICNKLQVGTYVARLKTSFVNDYTLDSHSRVYSAQS